MSEFIEHPDHWCRHCDTRIVGSNNETHPCPYGCTDDDDAA